MTFIPILGVLVLNVWVFTYAVPSLPPQNVSSYNTSSTSIYVSWHEVSHGFVHGILLGYRVLYKVASEIHNNSVVSTSETTKEKELQGLKKFTMYEIAVLAFTRIGDGVNSTSIFVSTDEDSKSQLIPLRQWTSPMSRAYLTGLSISPCRVNCP